MKFVFWNIKEKDDITIGNTIKDLIVQEDPDVLLLAESHVTDTFLENNCNMKFVNGVTKKSFGLNKPMRLYAKLKSYKIIPVKLYGDGEIVVCGFQITKNKIKENYLIFGCHFVSKITVSDEHERLDRFIKYREFIDSTEKEYTKPPKCKIKNFKGSIVFGDFNTNPFELAFTNSLGLFAIDVKHPFPKKLAKYKYFINPTLSILGNYSFNKQGKASAPGTFYFEDKKITKPSDHYWNALDGMIFSPELHDSYDSGEPLEIIPTINNIAATPVQHILFDSLTRKIDSAKYSDHLPIKFKFNL